MVSLQDIYLAEFARKKGSRDKKGRKKKGKVVGLADNARDIRQTWGLGQRSLSTLGHLSREARGWKKILG